MHLCPSLLTILIKTAFSFLPFIIFSMATIWSVEGKVVLQSHEAQIIKKKFFFMFLEKKVLIFIAVADT